MRNNAADGVPPGPFDYSFDSVFGGGTVGYNWQHKSLLIGIEGDVGYMDPDGEGRIPSSTPPNYQALTLDSGLYADITARLGVTFDRTLVYAKGGYAYYDGEAMQATTKPGYVPTGTDSLSGWVLGGGVEHFFAPNLSLKAEYLHFDFDTESGYQTNVGDLSSPIGYRFYNWHDVEIDTVKVGINYHFNAPEPAPLK
ncbi:MAG: outer membrane beta-barrel protein [Hyphomicrobium sp.]|uniref:outer membrane protein n=1 Tax=Hyphomicrobium sp. TaxID=82 RepID=UPI0025C58F96|nr:outer membrane beta-barrel protein [Hyphomicrobium sp.]MBZ0211232.1 outer membrane beta-barrel protein [Hyphomicrobium sp.]